MKRRYQVLLLTAVIGLAVLIVKAAISQDTREPGIVRAQEFDLVGKNGAVWASLSLTREGTPSLTMNDSHGNHRISIVVDNDGDPSISLLDVKGQERASLAVIDRPGEPPMSDTSILHLASGNTATDAYMLVAWDTAKVVLTGGKGANVALQAISDARADLYVGNKGAHRFFTPAPMRMSPADLPQKIPRHK